MKLNKKGYMLVEIIVSFVIAFSIAIYLLNLTIKFKDTNEEIYYSARYLKDKNLITMNIMEDLDRGIIKEIEHIPGSYEIKFKIYIDGLETNEETRKLLMHNDESGFSIEYGSLDESGNFNKTDESYYKKTLEKSLMIDITNIKINTNSTENIFNIKIPINSMYTKEKYDIIILGKSYGEVYFNKKNISDYIKNLYNDGSTIKDVHIAGDTSKPKVYLNETQSIMLDNNEEYRYYGASPNNYVDFNGELWRIISVSKVFSSESDTTGETRVRIIKDTSIGYHAWNGEGTNNWAAATLMCQLNTMYYNDTLPACTGKSLTSLNTSLNTEAQNLIDNALWYLGGGNSTDLYADDYYTMERGTTTYGSNQTRWTGKIGIMYPSDYAYAADLSLCKLTGYNYESEGSNCATTDWLFNSGYQWLISHNSSFSPRTWSVDRTGYVDNGAGNYVGNFWMIRPVGVLKPDVTIVEGEGTNANPYKIELTT